MVSFSRLFDIASKAAGKASAAKSSPSASGSRDWRDMVRSAADAVTGDARTRTPGAPPADAADRYAPPAVGRRTASGTALPAEDRAAIARYDYLLRTADPDRVEQMHREAFARLTPAQRAHVRERMYAELSPHERPRSDAPDDLARTAARAEAARPGRMSSLLAQAGKGGLIGAGVVGAGGLLAAVAGGAIVSAVAAPLLAQAMQSGVDFTGLAEGVDLEAMASGVDLASLAEGTGIGEWVGGAQDAVSGAGDQISGFGESLSNFDIPGFGDFLGR
ncbi:MULTISPECIES: cation-transporting ATPase [Microbacterium]|uniref:Cation-transporting ATPase n=1 Tax=Microbacterium algihabitans TaxID=3075992 RepID=A0ABU3RUZ4_9MICO|nr:MULTISPECIES: cation-transporting ATPase [Microbacterium]MDU0326673.1 cation-transporting ATPase [Microbacterium sp. KSW2-21]